MRAGQQNEKIRAIYGGLTTPEGKWNGQVRFLHERLAIPKRVKKPTVLAVWMDLFHPDVSPLAIVLTLRMMDDCPQHTFLVLTKRPEVALEHFTKNSMFVNRPLPKNLWMGVTAENQEQADKRIPILLEIPAAVRFVSVEPMLGPVDLQGVWNSPEWFCPACDREVGAASVRYDETHDICGSPVGSAPPQIDWVICGGETGPGARPMHPDWTRSLRDQCQTAGVSFFFKQFGEWVEDPDCALRPLHPSAALMAMPDVGRPTNFRRVGKKAAGRLLDGREWNEMPGVE